MCPWSEWEAASLFFCEERLCAFVQTPSNTYSNVAYLLVGLALLRRAPDVAVIALLVAFGSFMFHASGTYFFEIWDVGAMFLFSGYALVSNIRRHVTLPNYRIVFACIVAMSVLAMIALKGIGIWLFAAQMIAAGALEIRAHRKLNEGVSRKPLFVLLALFAIAWGAWWLDVTKTICDPTNHILQGHAIWHVVNSLCFVCMAKFYEQFRSDGTSPSATSAI
jgi:hypothetical protein